MRSLGFTRVHITSCTPRSGTTLLTELMTHGFRFDAWSEHEMDLFNRPRPSQCHGRVLTKSPTDIVTSRYLLDLWKDLWVICVVRDPRDVVVSRHRGAPDRYYVGLNNWKEGYGHMQRLAAHPRVLTLRYEDLAEDPDGVQAKIAAFLPWLERRAAFSTFHEVARPSEGSSKALGGVRPVSSSSVGAWRRHLPRIASQVARHGPIDDVLYDLGYEADTEWKRELDGIEPDGLPSYFPEFPTAGQRWQRRLWILRNWVRCVLGIEVRADLVTATSAGSGAEGVARPRLEQEHTHQFGVEARRLVEESVASGNESRRVVPPAPREPFAVEGLHEEVA